MGNDRYKSGIYLWSYLYLLIVLLFSRFNRSNSMVIWGIYLVLAIPFYAHLDKFAIICFLLSTLSDYFSGVGQGIMGLHLILIILTLVSFITKKRVRLSLRGLLFPFMLIVSIWLSYYHSAFHYINGAYSMTYIVIICMVIIGFIKIDNDTLFYYLPALSLIITVYFVIVLLTTGRFSPSMLSIRNDINHNAFGRCLAQLSTVFVVKILLSKNKKTVYPFVWGITIILTLMTGSRNAFLAEIITAAFVFILVQKQKGRVFSKITKVLILVSIVLLIAEIVLPENWLFSERYNVATIISTGGTNRTTIWKRLIPLLIKDYTWFGYGPGYYCSAQIVYPLVNRAYTNTHNILVEAWGQLGIIGLLCFVAILVHSIHNCTVNFRKKELSLFIFAILIDLLINGIGEAMFAGTDLWIIIGLCYSMKTYKETNAEDSYEYSNSIEKQVSCSI